MESVYIGIDDTDMLDVLGTGQLARALAQHLETVCGVILESVSRHQLLQDPRIPCTRKNCCSCLVVQTNVSMLGQIIDTARVFVKARAVEGSDPGLCVAREDQLLARVHAYGWRAKREVLNQSDALVLARSTGLVLESLGGTDDGIIGALAAVGLRASGDDGWLTMWRGIRVLTGNVPVARLLQEDIDAVEDEAGNALHLWEEVNTLGKVRPLLRNGRVVLKVRRSETAFWYPVRR